MAEVQHRAVTLDRMSAERLARIVFDHIYREGPWQTFGQLREEDLPELEDALMKEPAVTVLIAVDDGRIKE